MSAPVRSLAQLLLEAPEPALPFKPGDPPPELWARDGLPPCPYRFLGARRTVRCWLQPCPVCCEGWVPLAPDHRAEGGYRLAVETGCNAGCADAAELTWWHLWRLGELPTPEPDERHRAYATGAVRRSVRDLPERPSEEELRRAAYGVGRWIAASGLPLDPVADALVRLAADAGHDLDTLAPKLAAALTAGSASPGRAPR